MADEWDLKKLRAWLEDKPVEVSVVIAVRSALRALPMLAEALDRDQTKRRDALVLPTFRASAVARVAGNGPTPPPTPPTPPPTPPPGIKSEQTSSICRWATTTKPPGSPARGT